MKIMNKIMTDKHIILPLLTEILMKMNALLMIIIAALTINKADKYMNRVSHEELSVTIKIENLMVN